MQRFALPIVGSLTSAVLLILGAGNSPGQGNKTLLSDEQFTKLVAADAKFLHDALAKEMIDKKMARKVIAAALMISACAECSSHPDSAMVHRNAELIFHYAEKGNWISAKQAAGGLYPEFDELKFNKLNPKGTFPRNTDLAPYMYWYASERVGGFGVDQELGQFLESKDKLTDDQFARLGEIGTRSAVLGQVADHFAPEKDQGKKTRQSWLAFTADFRQAAQGLTTAAAGKNDAAVHKALEKLDAACTKCHDVFK
jgi:hypothetical protein